LHTIDNEGGEKAHQRSEEVNEDPKWCDKADDERSGTWDLELENGS